MNAWLVSYLALNFLALGVVLAKHGQPKSGNYNVWSTMLGWGISLYFLFMGGAFQ